MAKTKYKQKPLFWHCIQYTGDNVAEMTEFCYLCVYDTNMEKLMFDGVPVEPTYWILQDQSGRFSMEVNEQFVAFFSLDQGN